jgi:hypothetical protein
MNRYTILLSAGFKNSAMIVFHEDSRRKALQHVKGELRRNVFASIADTACVFEGEDDDDKRIAVFKLSRQTTIGDVTSKY